MDARAHSRGLLALENGIAAIDRSDLRVLEARGADAVTWLDALVTSDIAGLVPGQLGRTLLLSPTGHLRADLIVVRTGDGLVLLQDPAQPDAAEALLAPYVLSADVVLEPSPLTLFEVPRDPGVPGTLWTARPGILGTGVLLALPADEHDDVADAIANTFPLAEADDVERHRVRMGVARFPVDLTPSSIPAEAGLDSALVHVDKGCFLGQESVAKVRNLGHPPVLVIPLWIDREVFPDDPVLENGERVGSVTSAAPAIGGTHVLARVRWKDGATERHLNDGRGHRYRPR